MAPMRRYTPKIRVLTWLGLSNKNFGLVELKQHKNRLFRLCKPKLKIICCKLYSLHIAECWAEAAQPLIQFWHAHMGCAWLPHAWDIRQRHCSLLLSSFSALYTCWKVILLQIYCYFLLFCIKSIQIDHVSKDLPLNYTLTQIKLDTIYWPLNQG